MANKIHTLKCDSTQYENIIHGRQCHTTRYNDRDYEIHDKLELCEVERSDGEFICTGREILVEITHIDTFGLQENYLCLSIE